MASQTVTPRQKHWIAQALRVGFLVVAPMLLLGCAHGRLMDQGDRDLVAGRYERAIHTYREALKVKPNHEKTQQKLSQAEAAFSPWLDRVSDAADRAYSKQQTGRALLLYGKLLEFEYNPTAQSRYQELQSQLLSAGQLPVNLNSKQKWLVAGVPEQVTGVLPSSSGLRLKASFSRMPVEVVEDTRLATGQYLAEVIEVPNPEIDHLQEKIANRHYRLKELRRDRKRQQRRYNELLAEWESVSGEEEEQPDPELDKESNKELKKALKKAEKRLAETKDRIKNSERKLDRAIERLSETPTILLEEIYADHSFDVTTRTSIYRAEVTVKEQGENFHYPLELVVSDEYHDAQEILGLAEDFYTYPDEAWVRDELQNRARVAIEKHLQNKVASRRSEYLYRAARTVRGDEKLELWVSYALSGPLGLGYQESAAMAEMLQQEFGVAGDFDSNALLLRSLTRR